MFFSLTTSNEGMDPAIIRGAWLVRTVPSLTDMIVIIVIDGKEVTGIHGPDDVGDGQILTLNTARIISTALHSVSNILYCFRPFEVESRRCR